MVVEIKMPQLGESVTEGTIAKWLVKPGDPVKKYQPIAEVITDKVNAELPAPQNGTIASLNVNEGETVKVGTLVATLAVEGAAAPAPADPAPEGAAPAPAAVAGPAQTAAAPVKAPLAEARPVATATRPATAGGAAEMRGRYSPAVLKLSQEHGVDLAQVQGTGLGGRITRKDVEAYIEARAQGKVPAAAAAGEAAAPAGAAARPAQVQPIFTGPGDQAIPVTPVRRRIAEKMLQSKHEIPHAWTMVRADVTGLVKLRNGLKDEFKAREGVNLTFLPFMIQAVTEALREYPMLNSTWAGDEIIVRREINISIAVATEDALAVPVIKNADRLSISGLAHAIHDLAQRAQAGRLTLDDIQGGTFTVNNTGAFGSFISQPIINYPQAAILSMESIVKEPVVLDDDAIAIRSMVNLCCSLDHRVLDGLVVGRFLQAVKRRLESYAPGNVTIY